MLPVQHGPQGSWLHFRAPDEAVYELNEERLDDPCAARVLRRLAVATGVSCTAIGASHLVGGVASVPGEAFAGHTVDSRERFYSALVVGYGLAWIWAGRQTPLPLRAVRGLAYVLLLGGVGRLLSVAAHGLPHWFQRPLTALELGLPPVFIALGRRAAAPVLPEPLGPEPGPRARAVS